MRMTLLSLTCALMTSAAWGEATPDGAADLTALFQTYLGTVPGVVKVAAVGADYLVTLDPAPLIALLPAEAGVTVSLSPFELTLTDKGDGTWNVARDQPFAMTLSVAGQVEMSVAIASQVCKGTFDEALMASTENLCTLTGMTLDQRVTQPDGGQSHLTYRLDKITFASTSSAGASGGVDTTVSYVATGLEETMVMALAPDAPPLTLRAEAEEYSVKGTTKGVRVAALYELIAWAVAHPSRAAMTADRAGVKAILERGLPFLDRIDAAGTITGVTVETPVGVIGVESTGVDISLGGAVADGHVREAVRFEGLTPPPGVLPPFAEGLLPDRFGVDVTVDGFDAAAALRMLMGLLDLPAGAEPGPDFGPAMLQALLPDGSVAITLAPGEVSNDVYTLTYEGAMTAGPGVMPTGTARVTARGYDAAVSILDGAPAQMTSGVLPAMGIARSLAKDGPDGLLVWDIDASEPGTLTVNGTDLMGRP